MNFQTKKIQAMVAPEFKCLKGEVFKLTKLSSSRPNWNVPTGMFEQGPLEFVGVLEGYGVKVQGRGWNDYIRTSPVVKVTDTTATSVTFQTEGGVYRLEAVDGQ